MMGYALASAARDLGMKVTLISGPVTLPCPKGVELVKIETALEMEVAMQAHFAVANLIIMCAAVCDHRPAERYEKKIRKDHFPQNITFVKNPDILKNLGSKKNDCQVLVGFAAETHDVLVSAKKKLKEKKLDWIVANDVSKCEMGFSSQQNEVTLIRSDGLQMNFPLSEKSKIAEDILKVFYTSCQEKAH